MKKIFLLLVAITTASQAQITPKVIQRFPAHIIYKIDEATSKVKLSEEQQLKLGKQLVRKDSIANALLHKSDSMINIKNYYTITKELLKQILSPEQMDQYQYQNYKNNRFLIALKSADILKLNSSQINALRKQNELVKATIPVKQRMENYTKKLDSILTKSQYTDLMKIVYEDQSRNQAANDWDNLIKAKLVTIKDSAIVFNKIYNYELLKNSILAIQSEKMDAKKRVMLKDKITIDKQPNVLTKYQIISDGFYKNNLFATAIQNETRLSLNPGQTDSLLVYYRKLELDRINFKFKNALPPTKTYYTDFENKNIAKILDPKQLNLLLFKKNEKTAKQLALNNWDELDKQGLVKDLDKNTILKDFAKYQLETLVAVDRIKMDKNQFNLFYKRDVERKKPALLQQLDEIKQTEANAKTTKNNLKW